MHWLADIESCRRFIDEFKGDLAAMRDLRAVVAERNQEIRRDPLLSDDEVRDWIVRLLASRELLLAREWPPHGGAATQSKKAEATPGTAAAPLRSVKTWIEIELLDDSGQPVPAEAYQIELPDGRLVRGRLDSEGKARFRNLDPGTCQVSFPEIEASEWEPA